MPLVENGFASDPLTRRVAARYLKPLREKNIDTLILGCTHYPLLKKVINGVMGRVTLVDSSSAVAAEAEKELLRTGTDTDRRRRKGRMKCYVSDDVEGFRRSSRSFLKEKTEVRKAVP